MNKTKTILIICLVVITAMMAGCAQGSGTYRNDASAPVGVSGTDGSSQGITVSGSGEIKVKPDMVTISMGVISRDKDLTTAQNQNATTMNAVIDALKKTAKEENIATSSLNISPVFDYNNPQPVLQGYEINNTVTVLLDDISQLGKLVDDAMAAGANQVYGINFSVKDDKKAYEEAMKLAVEDARAKASVLAEATGVKIDGIIAVNESSMGSPIYREAMPMAKAADSIGGTIQSGSLSVTASVSIVFGYK